MTIPPAPEIDLTWRLWASYALGNREPTTILSWLGILFQPLSSPHIPRLSRLFPSFDSPITCALPLSCWLLPDQLELDVKQSKSYQQDGLIG